MQVHEARRPEAVAALPDPAASGIELHGQLQVAASTWFVYGATVYDGEVVVGRYPGPAEAADALRVARHLPGLGGERPVR